jgi:hypothetical protein
MNETEILRRTQLLMTNVGGRAFRNNVGRAQTIDGNWIQFGLCVGSSDLIGWVPVTIEARHVGRRFAIFSALEVKSLTGSATVAQRRFLAAVQEAGGVAEIVKKPGDLERILEAL